MSTQDDAGLRTLGLIALFRAGVSPVVSMLREAGKCQDIAMAIEQGRLERRGELLREISDSTGVDEAEITKDKGLIHDLGAA